MGAPLPFTGFPSDYADHAMPMGDQYKPLNVVMHVQSEMAKCSYCGSYKLNSPVVKCGSCGAPG